MAVAKSRCISRGTVTAAAVLSGVLAPIMPSALSIIGHVPWRRIAAAGHRFVARASGVGIALGPIIDGLLLAHFWW